MKDFPIRHGIPTELKALVLLLAEKDKNITSVACKVHEFGLSKYYVRKILEIIEGKRDMLILARHIGEDKLMELVRAKLGRAAA